MTVLDLTRQRLVNMNKIGAGDIAVGQEWMPTVAEIRLRVPWTVASIDGDKVTLERAGSTQRVSFGSLLAMWGLLR